MKKFKKLLKRKVDEKLAQCRSGVGAKLGDINHNVVEPGSERAEFVQVEDWDMKEVTVEAELGKVAEDDLEDATLSGEGCVKEDCGAGGFNKIVAEVAAVIEEVVSEEGPTEEEEDGLDFSEDLKAEEEDPGYIQWKLAYLKSKLMELEEKEALGTSTLTDCGERGIPEMRLSEGRVWISEESVNDSKAGQIETGDTSEAEDKGSILGGADMELEEGEVIESEICVESQDVERVFILPSGFLEAVVKACTKEPAGRSGLKLVKKKVPSVKEGCKKALEQKVVLEDASNSEPDPSALEHLDLRPPQSSHPPFTLMMHQQVNSDFSAPLHTLPCIHRWYLLSPTASSRNGRLKVLTSPGKGNFRKTTRFMKCTDSRAMEHLQARPLLSHRVALAQRPGRYAGNTSLETLSGDPSLPLIGG